MALDVWLNASCRRLDDRPGNGHFFADLGDLPVENPWYSDEHSNRGSVGRISALHSDVSDSNLNPGAGWDVLVVWPAQHLGAGLFAYLFVPETKGKSLEEIQATWAHR